METRRDTKSSLDHKISQRRDKNLLGSTRMTRMMSKTLSIDLFRESFQFQLPNGQSSLPSFTGTFFSMWLIFFLLLYGCLEMATVVMRSNSDVFLVEVDSYFDDTYVFESDKLPGLQIAFGLTAYDSNYNLLNETEYAQVKARMRSWSPE